MRTIEDNPIFMKSKLTNFAIVLLLMILGFYFVALKFVHYDFSRIPGDMGDARFNNYILEHGYHYLAGKIQNYWDASFMYPYKNVIALSDNLLGTVPIYSLFRLIGVDRETSFQYWLMALFVLNFLCCYWALKKWSGDTILSAVGAYIFAFGIYNHGQIFHVQVFPRFISPLLCYWFWKYLNEKEVRYFLYTSIGLVFQFYCGLYLGFFMLYLLLFFFIAYLVIYRDFEFFKKFNNRKYVLGHLGTIILSIIIFLPLILPYYNVSTTTGVRSFDTAFNSLPRPISYFFTSPASDTWNFLYPITAYSFNDWWNHFLFPGGLPMAGILLIPVILFSNKITKIQKHFIVFLAFALILMMIFCINIHGLTLYKIIYNIPGFSSMRSLDRIINVQILFFVFIFVFVSKYLLQIFPSITKFVYLLPILVVLDNMMTPEDHKSIFKAASTSQIESIKQNIRNQFDEKHVAIAYIPLQQILVDENERNSLALEVTIGTMLAAQELGISCVNGYTGFNPGNFEQLFINPGVDELNKWSSFNNIDPKTIQIINEIGSNIISIDTINIKSSNGKFICADETLNNQIIPNKDHAQSWETFKIIYFENNLCVIRSHKNLFFSLNPLQNNYIAATSSKISENEIFIIENTSSNDICFKAANGKYLTVNAKDNYVYANGVNSEMAEKFTILDSSVNK